MRLVSIIALSLVSFASSACSLRAQEPYSPPGLTAEFRTDAQLKGITSSYLPNLYASSHAANLLLLRNGDVLCFWFSGSKEGASNVAVVMSRLPKGSNTWDKTILVDREPAKSYQNPVGFEADNGDIWLLHSAQSAGKGQADAKVMNSISHDGGRTWSKSEDVFTKAGSFTRQPIVHGDHGELLLPLFYSNSAGTAHGISGDYSSVKVSRDQGKTWEECPVPQSNGIVHMNILKLGTERYVSFFRSRYADFIYRSTSSDGCHWEPPVATTLPNNNASIQATMLRNGHIVMAFDNVSGPKSGHVLHSGPRAPLSLALSKDGGVTWGAVRDLEVRDKEGAPPLGSPEYSYPAVQQLPNGKILAAYTYRRLGIKAVELQEKWISQGTTEGKYKPQSK